MATTIHATRGQVTGCCARGEQRAGQRKRQREHRMREADEREIRARRAIEVHHDQRSRPARPADPPTCRSSHPAHSAARRAHEMLFHVGDILRHVDGDQLGALARLDRAELVAEARAPRAPDQRRAFEQRRAPAPTARATASSSAPRTGSDPRRWPGCRCRPRPRRPTRRIARSAARRRRPTGCCAGRSRACSRSRASRARLVVRQLHAVHDQRPRVENAEPIEILDRPAPGRRPVVARSADEPQHAGHRPGAVARETPPRSSDSPRCTLVIGIVARDRLRRRIARNSSGDTEYGACGATDTRTRSAPRGRGRHAHARASRPPSGRAAG